MDYFKNEAAITYFSNQNRIVFDRMRTPTFGFYRRAASANCALVYGDVNTTTSIV